jgi:hypothetical protein
MLAFVVLAALLPSSIADWLPSHPGDRWVYEVKILDRDNGHPHVEAWQEEIKTVAIRELPSGTLIERTVTLLNHTAPVRSAATWSPKSDILIRRNCLYFLTGKSSQPDSVPDVCFPLHAGAMWGDSAKYRDRWLASGQGHKQPTDEPASITPQSWRLEAHRASGDDDYVWFQRGVGVVAKRTFHHGTYYDYQVRLLRFHPANWK